MTVNSWRCKCLRIWKILQTLTYFWKRTEKKKNWMSAANTSNRKFWLLPMYKLFDSRLRSCPGIGRFVTQRAFQRLSRVQEVEFSLCLVKSFFVPTWIEIALRLWHRASAWNEKRFLDWPPPFLIRTLFEPSITCRTENLYSSAEQKLL